MGIEFCWFQHDVAYEIDIRIVGRSDCHASFQVFHLLGRIIYMNGDDGFIMANDADLYLTQELSIYAVIVPEPGKSQIVIANYAAVLERLEELGELTGPTRLAQIVRDGPGLGVFTFVAASSERDVPSRVAQQVEARLVLRLADPNAYMMFGLKTKEVPELGPGRLPDRLGFDRQDDPVGCQEIDQSQGTQITSVR